MSRIFISYKRNIDPDDRLANNLFSLLNKDHEVFIDKSIKIGSEWAKEINEKLNSAEYFIPLISKNSIESDMVVGEIETAYRLSKKNGIPVILPVMVSFEEALQYPLSAYLNRINWAVWECERDTEVISANIKAVIFDRSKTNYNNNLKIELPVKPSVIQLENPDNYSESFVEFQPHLRRREEQIIENYLNESGATITIRAPRYTGKRSLITRLIQSQKSLGAKVALIDFHLFDKSTLTSTDVFFQQFCEMITKQLGFENRVEEHWSRLSSPIEKCTNYIEEFILGQIEDSFILIIDEVEKLLGTDFCSDFFSMLRGWHNSRAVDDVWLNLSLVTCVLTEPYLLVNNFHQSPFNVGHTIYLSDFSRTEVYNLNVLYEEPFTEKQLDNLMNLLGGHVFLISQSMQIVKREHFSADELLKRASDDFGPFSDHLRGNLFWIQMEENKELLNGLFQILRNESCDENVLLRLLGEGLVSIISGKITPRCKLYTDYFSRKLKESPE